MEGILRLDSLRIPLRQVRYLYLATVYVLTSDPPPSGLLSILGPRSCPYRVGTRELDLIWSYAIVDLLLVASNEIVKLGLPKMMLGNAIESDILGLHDRRQVGGDKDEYDIGIFLEYEGVEGRRGVGRIDIDVKDGLLIFIQVGVVFNNL